MPCHGCGKQGTQQLSKGLNSNLDVAVTALTAAWITDVDPEQREQCSKLIQGIQLLAHPHPIPLDMQFQSLHQVNGQVTAKVLCRYCRMFTYYDMVKSAEVHWRLARGERYLAFKCYLEKEVKKYYWLAPARLLQPILVDPLSRCIRRFRRSESQS